MCYNPITLGEDDYGNEIKVSCRKCIECRQTRANEWAVRCYAEMEEHEENCFVTLTYEYNPIRLIKEDVQKFMKRLRKKIQPIKIKYFLCGEYGDVNLRPHFHIIIFGYDFQDKRLSGKSGRDNPYFMSSELDKIWGKGRAIIQDVNAQVIKYTALYNSKTKKNGNLPPHLWNYPEFNTMSQSLGVKPLLERMETYLKTDEIYLEGFAHQIPKIILEKFSNSEFDTLEDKLLLFEEVHSMRHKRELSKRELELKEQRAIKKKEFTRHRMI